MQKKTRKEYAEDAAERLKKLRNGSQQAPKEKEKSKTARKSEKKH